MLLLVVYLQYKSGQKQAETLEKLVETLHDIEVQMHSIGDLKAIILAKILNSPSNDS